jgi:hypothetical protein
MTNTPAYHGTDLVTAAKSFASRGTGLVTALLNFSTFVIPKSEISKFWTSPNETEILKSKFPKFNKNEKKFKVFYC